MKNATSSASSRALFGGQYARLPLYRLGDRYAAFRKADPDRATCEILDLRAGIRKAIALGDADTARRYSRFLSSFALCLPKGV